MNDEMPTDGVSGELMPVSDEEWARMQQSGKGVGDGSKTERQKSYRGMAAAR